MNYTIFNIINSVNQEAILEKLNTFLGSDIFDINAILGGSGSTTQFLSKGIKCDLESFVLACSCHAFMKKNKNTGGFIEWKEIQNSSELLIMRHKTYFNNGKLDILSKKRDENLANDIATYTCIAIEDGTTIFHQIAECNNFSEKEYFEYVINEIDCDANFLVAGSLDKLTIAQQVSLAIQYGLVV